MLIVHLKVKVFQMAAETTPFIYPLRIPTIQCWVYISLAAEDITPTNILTVKETFDRLQPKVCQHFFRGL